MEQENKVLWVHLDERKGRVLDMISSTSRGLDQRGFRGFLYTVLDWIDGRESFNELVDKYNRYDSAQDLLEKGQPKIANDILDQERSDRLRALEQLPVHLDLSCFGSVAPNPFDQAQAPQTKNSV